MKQIIKTSEGQTLLDIAVQHTGDAAEAFAIALNNGLNFSDDLAIGVDIEVPEATVEKTKMVVEFENKLITPASKKDDGEDALVGIDYWEIENNFIIQ